MKPLAWLQSAMILLFIAITSANAQDSPDVSCQVALPSNCIALPAREPERPRTPRTVQVLPASSLNTCLGTARQAADKCISEGSASEIVVRFRQGPVEVRRRIGAPVPRHKGALSLPITYGKNFESEFEQFGYSPNFAPGVVNIANDGRLWIRHQGYLQIRDRDGKWTFSDLKTAAEAAIKRVADVEGFEWVWDNRSAHSDQRIYFDKQDRAYTLVQGGWTRIKDSRGLTYRPYLLYSQDRGLTWSALAIAVPDQRLTWRARIEYNDGNNDRTDAPPVLVYDRAEDARRSSRLYLHVPKWERGVLNLQTGLLISERSLLQENHSGAANSLVSTANRIYVVYPSSEPIASLKGTPAYLVVYDKDKGVVVSESWVGQGGEASTVDNHNIPGICIGTGSSAHVVLPGHHDVLRVRSGSLATPVDAWQSAVQVGEAPTRAGGYTYASLNCDRAGNVLIVSRWAGDNYQFQLVALRKSVEGAWLPLKRAAHQVLLDPGRPFYGVWRHKVSLDDSGSLYLFYAYYANQLTQGELSALQDRFPFNLWSVVKELQPKICVSGQDPRCWLHPMPEVTSAVLRSRNNGASWHFME